MPRPGRSCWPASRDQARASQSALGVASWEHFWAPWPVPFLALGKNSSPLHEPWPKLLIACGRNSIAYSSAIRERSAGGTFVVQCQDPRIDTNYFDLVVPPEHDGLTGDNVMSILGSPNRINATSLDKARDEFAETFRALPRPLVAVLIGGESRHYKMTNDRIDNLILELKALVKSGHGLAITTSRRTAKDIDHRLQANLTGDEVFFWDGNEPNPYLGMLAHADHILVTEESTNMVTEAAGTGKPVHVIRLKGGAPKFDEFHRQMIAREIARPFQGELETWTYEPLNETARVAEEIKKRLNL